jgi:hypothetical protein
VTSMSRAGSSCLKKKLAWSNMKEDCYIDRGITLDLVLYPAIRCPNLMDCGEFVVVLWSLSFIEEWHGSSPL